MNYSAWHIHPKYTRILQFNSPINVNVFIVNEWDLRYSKHPIEVPTLNRPLLIMSSGGPFRCQVIAN